MTPVSFELLERREAGRVVVLVDVVGPVGNRDLVRELLLDRRGGRPRIRLLAFDAAAAAATGGKQRRKRQYGSTGCGSAQQLTPR